MKKSVFFKRLFVTYISIIILYTFIASSLYYYNRNEFNQKKMQDQNKVFVEQARDKIDMRLSIAFDLMNQLKANSEVLRYASNTKKDYYNILQLHKQLHKHLDAFSRFGYQISIGKIEDDMLITPAYTINANRYLDEEDFPSLDKQHIDDFFSKEQSSKPYIVKDTDEQSNNSTGTLMYITKEVLDEKMKNILFFLNFNKNDLLPTLHTKTKDAFLVLDDNQIILSNKQGLETETIQNILSEDILTHITSNESQDTSYFSLKNEDYYIHVISSKVQSLKWKYVYITPKDTFRAQTVTLGIKTAVMYIFLLLMGLILALVVSWKLYRPVNKIMNIFDEYPLQTDKNQLENNDEFSYIEKTVSRISEKNEELQRIIKNSQVPLKTKFLRELMYGILSEEQIKVGMDKYNLDDFHSTSTIIVLEYVTDQEFEGNISREAILAIKKKVLSHITQFIVKKWECEVFELDYKRYVIWGKGDNLGQIKKELNELLFSIESEFDINMIAAVGKSAENIYEVQNSFKDTLNILEYQFVWGHKIILTDDDLQDLKSETYYYPLDMERNLIDDVLKGKMQEVDHSLNRILDENLEIRTLKPNILSQFIFAIVATSNRIMQKMLTVDKQMVENRKITYLELKMCETKEQLRAKVLDLFHELVSHCTQKKEQAEHTVIDEIISFIHTKYNVDLSLTDIAEHFNLSVGYAGILFKKSTGENFKDYLNELKVEKAKEILEKEDVKIKDLAQRVGCNTTNTFIRMFKKYEGISPGQYKEKTKNT